MINININIIIIIIITILILSLLLSIFKKKILISTFRYADHFMDKVKYGVRKHLFIMRLSFDFRIHNRMFL